ncbi:MAG: BTAD domain-containing putative transcriptional regulator [Actinomycetota bacterium]
MARHGSTISLGSPAQRTILAALLVQRGAVVSVDRLVDALWGERPPETALESLRTHVYRLRRALHDGATQECLVTRPPGYVLDVDPDTVDAGRFERLVAEARDESPRRSERAAAALEKGLGLWRGPAFAEFADAKFAAPEAARLEDLRLAATEDLFDLKLTLGRHSEVVAECEAFVAENPWRERAHEQLIIALYRCGQQSRALEVYRSLRERLDRELGLEPSQRLRALENAVLQHSPDLAWEPQQPTGAASVGAGNRAGRLPWERTSFVGRTRETSEVVAALDGHRIVCLVGAGGVGKSRLALRAAREAADRYADGAWWCDLAAVTAPDAVLDALAGSLGVLPGTDESVESSVVDFLAGRQALLVVDNCEHVAEEVTRLLGTLVERCRQVTVLATSRIALDVTGARTWTVGPLPVTEMDDGEVMPAAVRLFMERARTVRAGLDHGTADLVHIDEICRRLDGLPLAIELAAARMRSLNPADIAERLDDRFRLLTRRPESRLPRQRTLRAVLDWSFDLLSATERRLFERLSVFAGEFTPAAAEQVCAGHPIEPGEIVDLLGRLVDASMVTVGPPHGEVSYRLLETLRAYGRSHLLESGDLERFRHAHAAYYTTLAEQAADGIRGPDEAAWVSQIDRDLANFREAHRWAVANPDMDPDVDLAMRLPAALFRYALWRLRDEVLRWAENTVSLPGAEAHPLWPYVCGAAGWGYGLRGQRDRALHLAEQGLAAAPPGDPGRFLLLEVQMHVTLWEGRLDDCIALTERTAELASDPYELLPWTVRALALAYAGRTDEALATAEQARYRADRLGNPTMMGLARYSVAEALMERDPDAAAPVLDQVIELAGRVQNRMVLGVAGVSSAALRARHGDPAVALRSSAAVLDVWAQTSDWTHLWVGLRSLAELLARVGADRAAAVLLGAVLDGSTGPPVYGADAARLADLAAVLEDRLGARDLAAARARGRAMAAAEVLDFARNEIDQAAAEL